MTAKRHDTFLVPARPTTFVGRAMLRGRTHRATG